MKVKHKQLGYTGSSSTFNTSALAEVIVAYDDNDDGTPGGMDSEFIRELDVLIDGEWLDMNEAFRRRLLIPNNHYTWFTQPRTEEEKERGYI